MNVPHRLVIALSDAGWYHRQTIIWAKATSGEIREGSCMPESVNDRLNQSFEYIFLLTKKDKYYFDSYAIKEPLSSSTSLREAGNFIKNKMGELNKNFNSRSSDYVNSGMASMRSVWRINLQPGSNGNHIAGFPEKIPYYCIKAGSSEKGCCNDCGKPYERILESKKIKRSELSPENINYRPNDYNGKYSDINGKGDAGFNETIFKGWKKTCNCESDEISPSLILDPFMGSGTVAVVALKEQRDFYGIELNPESQTFAMERIKPHFYKSKNLF
jgi:DNA modification methylase